MKLDDKKISSLLYEENYITKENLEKAEKSAKEGGISIIEYLQSVGLVSKDLIGQAIAEFLGVHYADLNTYQPSMEQVLKIPEEIAKKYRIVLFKETEEEAVLACDDIQEKNIVPKDAEKLFNGKKVTLAYALSEDIDAAFIFYRKGLDTRFSAIIAEKKRVAPEIIEEIIQDAVAYRASDIHFEPQDKEVVIRFRIDGVMHQVGRIPKEYYGNILNRIKVQTHLPIDEHFSAQDGAIRYSKENLSVDMRVSILPTLDGEKVVIRLLSQYVRSFTFSDLGLSEKHQNLLLAMANKPFGMILVTGPTGSGKTTSLYALLKLLNKPEVNITTIEDPVEYKVSGINQIQVNLQTNLTFAKGLRSIVRQDPDIILVGEIRDKETAEIAVNAALTGHLLLSTFHANDSVTAIPRLLDMEVEPFLLASTLQVLIAQRLVRRICEQCKYSISVDQEKIRKYLPEHYKRYFPGAVATMFASKGCGACGNTGYKGRIAIYEFIEITPEVQELILKNPSAGEIWELARKQGSSTLFEDGIDKVKNGVTTLEELLRVAEPPKY